jgi:hypothetical protein
LWDTTSDGDGDLADLCAARLETDGPMDLTAGSSRYANLSRDWIRLFGSVPNVSHAAFAYGTYSLGKLMHVKVLREWCALNEPDLSLYKYARKLLDRRTQTYTG